MGKRIAKPPKVATWNIWLISKTEPPALYCRDVTEGDMSFYYMQAMGKVFDGSDADGLIVTRSDYDLGKICIA